MTNKLRIAYVLQWIIGVLTTLAIGGGSAWMSHINDELNTLQKSDVNQSNEITRVGAFISQGEKRLDRIESKIDQLLNDKRRN
jgi:hypothetical protein